MKKPLVASPDRIPDVGPRVLGIVWSPGEQPYFENPQEFAFWEMKALLERALEIVEEDEQSASEQEES